MVHPAHTFGANTQMTSCFIASSYRRWRNERPHWATWLSTYAYVEHPYSSYFLPAIIQLCDLATFTNPSSILTVCLLFWPNLLNEKKRIKTSVKHAHISGYRFELFSSLLNTQTVDYCKIYLCLLLEFFSCLSIKGNVFHYPVGIFKEGPQHLSLTQICKAGVSCSLTLPS